MTGTKKYIAVITPIAYGSHGEILSGIGTTIDSDDGEYRVIPYITRSLDRSAFVLATERALYEGAQLLVTVGQSASIVVKDLLVKKKVSIPQICVVSGDPVATGIMESRERSKALRTAVGVAEYDREQVVRLTLGQSPTIKTALLPLVQPSVPGATWWSDANEEVMKRQCWRYRIELAVLKSKSYTDLFAQVFERIPDYDALFLMEGDLLLEGHFTLSRRCYENKTVCYAGSYPAVTSTAFCGYIGGMGGAGRQVREYIQQILKEGNECIRELPYVEIPNRREPIINADIARLFGPLLPPAVSGVVDGCGQFVSAPDAWHEEQARIAAAKEK
ncbi:MAG: hypothetical protein PVJ92_00410 [Candidatus Dependentiae bacterium]|jgi:hypothetical protein